MKNTLLINARNYLGMRQYDARHQAMIQAYNQVVPLPRGYAMKLNDEWCAAFVSVLFDELPQRGLFPRECGAHRQYEHAKEQRLWIGRSRPQAGDVVFWDWDGAGWFDHVGIVESVDDDGWIGTIEGNSRRAVARNRYYYLDKRIAGYARPQYSELDDGTDVNAHAGNGVNDGADVEVKSAVGVAPSLVQQVIRGDFGDGSERILRLRALGHNPDIVQQAVNREMRALANANQDEEVLNQLADEVILGAWGDGLERIQRLTKARHSPADVQHRVNRILAERAEEMPESPDEVQCKVNPILAEQKCEVHLALAGSGADEGAGAGSGYIADAGVGSRTIYQKLTYQQYQLSGDIIETIVSEARPHFIMPDFLIVMLYVESYWGASQVGQHDNNWAGITWSPTYKGHPDVIKQRGLARPRREGGHYIRYRDAGDFIKDWIYLLRPCHLYRVSCTKDITEFTKGLFRIGGAKYDYAASGYDHYLGLMTGAYDGIVKENGGIIMNCKK